MTLIHRKNTSAHKKASVSVLLVTPNDEVVVQLRDEITGIENPGCWSLIGGWIEVGEEPIDAINRELHEEVSVSGGEKLSLGPITFMWSDDRTDRPWTEYIFHAEIRNSHEKLLISEGQSIKAFNLDQCMNLEKFAPHHKLYIKWFYHSFHATQRRIELKKIEDYIHVTNLGTKKDYPALESGNGYVVSTTNNPTAGVHTLEPANFIALLEFANNVPRGNHYHHSKVEHMVVLRGNLNCKFESTDNKEDAIEIDLAPGQMVSIQPGCVHTYTAIGGDVLAMEYSPQRYQASDVTVLD